MERQSGVLNPIFSLPSKYGIGDFGVEAKNFIDFLAKANQKVWQILPLVQTGFGSSPYSSVSAESFNPYFISLDELYAQGLIKKADLKRAKYESKYIDYDYLFKTRILLLRKAYKKFNKRSNEFKAFKKQKKFLDYALFMAIKSKNDDAPFYKWEDGLKFRDKNALKDFYRENRNEVNFWLFIQFEAQREWFLLKSYANEKGIKIMGDMPLYVALDSVDVWTNAELFKLNADFSPKKVAGVPPDYFSKTGQLWGNPVYDYDVHKKTKFKWWVNRVKNALDVYDLVRIDHFRGLDRYYEIEANEKTAEVGKWVKVPSDELFSALEKKVDKSRIVAEDLGILDDGVWALLKKVGCPGMKILQFAFDSGKDNVYLPENITENSICYTGTHDNDTLIGYLQKLNDGELSWVKKNVQDSLRQLKIRKKLTDIKSVANAIISLGFKCKSNLFVIPMTDLLLKDTAYRINEPGTVKPQNWAVRTDKSFYTNSAVKRLKTLTEKYQRV